MANQFSVALVLKWNKKGFTLVFILGFLRWGLEEGVYMVDSLVWLYYTILLCLWCENLF